MRWWRRYWNCTAGDEIRKPEGDYSRQEIVDGLKYVVDYYGYGSLLEAFAEDILADGDIEA